MLVHGRSREQQRQRRVNKRPRPERAAGHAAAALWSLLYAVLRVYRGQPRRASASALCIRPAAYTATGVQTDVRTRGPGLAFAGRLKHRQRTASPSYAAGERLKLTHAP